MVVRIVDYLLDIARVPTIGTLYACDQHGDNFGEDTAGRVKLLDVDALFTAQDLSRQRKPSCIDDWECSVRNPRITDACTQRPGAPLALLADIS